MKFKSSKYSNLSIYGTGIKFSDGDFETSDPDKINRLLVYCAENDHVKPIRETPTYTPLVSIIMACYNAQDYIKTAIDSVKAQTYDKWELVIVNDASTDNTADVIESETADIKDRVQVHTYKRNGNPGRSRKKACQMANGDVFAIVDGDDAIKPEALELVCKTFAADPFADIVYSTYYKCDKELIPKSTAKWTRQIDKTEDCTKATYLTHLCAIKRRCYELSPGYSAKFNRATDKYLYYHLLRYGRARYIDKPLYYYRRLYTTDQSNKGKRNNAMFQDAARQREKGVSVVIPHKNRRKLLDRCLDSILKQNGKYEVIVVNEGKRINRKGVKCVQAKGYNSSKFRNIGAKEAKYATLLFIDGDIVMPEGFINSIEERVRYNSPYFPIVKNEIPDDRCRGVYRVWGYGVIGIKSRDFWTVGGWDEYFKEWGGEDPAIHWKCKHAGMDIQRDKTELVHLYHKTEVQLTPESIKKNKKRLADFKEEYICGRL